MNNAELYLTPTPVALSGQGSTSLALNQAINVLAYDSADLMLLILSLTGTSPTADVEIWTGMQTNTLDGWYKAGNWLQQTVASTAGLKLNIASLQKYIIWKVTLGGTSPLCTFYVAGVVRQS